MRVLTVDDFRPMRSIIRSVLEEVEGVEVVEAEDGLEALTLLRESRFDLVISDWNMPRMNGLELLRHVRSEEHSKNTPFLMVTVRSSKQDVLQAISGGVSSYLVKPFSPDSLKEKINGILAAENRLYV